MQKGRKEHAQDRKVAKAKRGKKRALESKWERGKCSNLRRDGQEKQSFKKQSKGSAAAPALEPLNPNCMKQTWVAERAISLIHDQPELFKQIEQKGDELFSNAKNAYESYMEHGEIDDTFVTSTIILAQLDTIFRSGIVDSNFGNAEYGDVLDLKKLIEIVPSEQFKAKNI